MCRLHLLCLICDIAVPHFLGYLVEPSQYSKVIIQAEIWTITRPHRFGFPNSFFNEYLLLKFEYVVCKVSLVAGTKYGQQIFVKFRARNSNVLCCCLAVVTKWHDVQIVIPRIKARILSETSPPASGECLEEVVLRCDAFSARGWYQHVMTLERCLVTSV